MRTAALLGQEEKIHYSTAIFRILLDTLARPGKLGQLNYPTFLGEPPRYSSRIISRDLPLNLYAIGALWSLLDREVTFSIAANGHWLEPSAPAVEWLALRSNAGVGVPNTASFAFFCDGISGERLADLNQGSLLEPELSATALLCVDVLAGSEKRLKTAEGWLTLELAGPGIRETQKINVAGLGMGSMKLIQATRQNHPLGVDIYLIDAAGRCVGLPRSTRLGVKQTKG